MPLTAVIKSTGEVVNILNYDHPRISLPTQDLSCPGCGGKVMIVTPDTKINHFRHTKHGVCSDYPGKGKHGNGESLFHVMGKVEMGRLVANDLASEGYPKDSIKVLNEEKVMIPERETHRWADAMVKCGDTTIVIETQISKQSYEEASQRIQDYQGQGYEVRYALSKAASKSPCWDAILEYECQAYILEFKQSIEDHGHIPRINYKKIGHGINKVIQHSRAV